MKKVIAWRSTSKCSKYTINWISIFNFKQNCDLHKFWSQKSSRKGYKVHDENIVLILNCILIPDTGIIKFDWCYKTPIFIKKVGFEVLTAVTMKSTVFWDVMPCSLVQVYWCFWSMYHLHFQGQRLSHASNLQKQAELPWR
jgi:hypothetical protein